jgi:hypothetical protein
LPPRELARQKNQTIPAAMLIGLVAVGVGSVVLQSPILLPLAIVLAIGGNAGYLRLRAIHPHDLSRLCQSGCRLCPECDYDLSACPASGDCPECGRAYTPQSLKKHWESLYTQLMPDAIEER